MSSNSKLMEVKNNIERLDYFINKGKDVLKSHRDSGPGNYRLYSLNSGLHAGWYSQTLTFLKSCLGSETTYCDQFSSLADKNSIGHVQKGIGVLNSIKDDFERGYVVNEVSPPPRFIFFLNKYF